VSGDFIKKDSPAGKVRRCRYCGEILQEGSEYCDNCGRRVSGDDKGYAPVSDRKAAIIRWIVGAVLVAVFLVLYFTLKK